MDEGESLHNIGKILLDSALTKAPAHCAPYEMSDVAKACPKLNALKSILLRILI